MRLDDGASAVVEVTFLFGSSCRWAKILRPISFHQSSSALVRLTYPYEVYHENGFESCTRNCIDFLPSAGVCCE